MAGWERFRRQVVGTQTEPQVRIGKNGALLVNGLAWDLIGCPMHVQLLYDRSQRRVGIKACEENSLDAYKVTKPTAGSASINAKSYLRYFKLEGFQGSVHRPSYDSSDGRVLVVKLPEPEPEVAQAPADVAGENGEVAEADVEGLAASMGRVS